MKFTKCDWCNEVPTGQISSMQIGYKTCDICAKCSADIAKKLEGKGETVVSYKQSGALGAGLSYGLQPPATFTRP